ncbi:hypothetical protein [Paracidovorax avenae]|uniref:hypothetical protein n=1 Tax=Paracidovorax avenae TaxID=80867 RepID=UPI000D228814|nr:hypothetical protein [Paracidovorax avenae]AVT13617.1 hypothetical protein C8235_12525 [Paracidovorax avenae]
MPATNSRTPWPFPTADAHPSPAPAAGTGTGTDSTACGLQVQAVEEDTLDSAVEETFPASDPVSVVSTKSVSADEGAADDPKATKR